MQIVCQGSGLAQYAFDTASHVFLFIRHIRATHVNQFGFSYFLLSVCRRTVIDKNHDAS